MKTISVRTFLRGEYKSAKEPTIVLNYSQPIGIWHPLSSADSWTFSDGDVITYTTASNTVSETSLEIDEDQ
jgi:hypothetical protein